MATLVDLLLVTSGLPIPHFPVPFEILVCHPAGRYCHTSVSVQRGTVIAVPARTIYGKVGSLSYELQRKGSCPLNESSLQSTCVGEEDTYQWQSIITIHDAGTDHKIS